MFISFKKKSHVYQSQKKKNSCLSRSTYTESHDDKYHIITKKKYQIKLTHMK